MSDHANAMSTQGTDLQISAPHTDSENGGVIGAFHNLLLKHQRLPCLCACERNRIDIRLLVPVAWLVDDMTQIGNLNIHPQRVWQILQDMLLLQGNLVTSLEFYVCFVSHRPPNLLPLNTKITIAVTLCNTV